MSTITNLGQLTDMTWPGTISAAAMVASGVTTDATIDTAASVIDSFYVAVQPDAKTRCIDGRFDPLFDEQQLGPQLPGGAPGLALADRLTHIDTVDSATFVSDAAAMTSRLIQLGITPGGHRDNHSADSTTTCGCGAIDAMDRIVGVMNSEQLAADHQRLVHRLLDENFDLAVYQRIQATAEQLTMRTGYFEGRHTSIEALASTADERVAVLEGDHQECLVVINHVEAMTLASNRVQAAFDGMQAFGYDVWFLLQVAQLLFPNPDQDDEHQCFIMAGVMNAVATTMTLTDGTQRLLVRQSEVN